LLAVGIALLTGLLAGIVSYLAVRVLKTGQYPPPGMRVMQDTKLRTGKEARGTAILALTLAALVLLGGMGLSGMLLWASRDLSAGPRSPRLEAAVSSTARARETVSSSPDHSKRTPPLPFVGVQCVTFT